MSMISYIGAGESCSEIGSTTLVNTHGFAERLMTSSPQSNYAGEQCAKAP